MNHTRHSISTKIATGLDVLGTLLFEQIGSTYKIPPYNPIILSSVIIMTYGLFRFKEEVTEIVITSSSVIKKGVSLTFYTITDGLDFTQKFVASAINKNIRFINEKKEIIKIKIIKMRALSNKNKYKFQNS